MSGKIFLHFGNIVLITVIGYVFSIYYLIKRYMYASRILDFKRENLEEEINTLNSQIEKQRSISASWEQKIIHYNNLRTIANEIQNLSLQQICHHIVNYSYYLLGGNKGTCLFYLVDSHQQKLNLFLSKKEDKHLVIKQKEGDIFDRWVVRHSASLLVENVKIDFRFDMEKAEYKPDRHVASLISSPLKVEDRFLGVLRLDRDTPYLYSQDDLRFLDTICNIGALGVENALLFQRIQELAIRDSLTFVYTKGYFWERLSIEIKRAIRNNKNICLLMIDIDNFKNYNDKYGHIAGDILLRNLGEIFLDNCSAIADSMVCRFGGEEFSIFLPNYIIEEAFNIAEKLRKKLETKKFLLRRQETNITLSIGLAGLSAEVTTAKDLVLKADTALYNAKRGGRNRVCFI